VNWGVEQKLDMSACIVSRFYKIGRFCTFSDDSFLAL
jgi:hypothetical protein